MHVVGWAAALVFLLPGGAGARAQQENAGQGAPPYAPPVSGYTVTGRVTCADTQHPARFAQVFLTGANAADEGGGRGGRNLGVRTDLDGSFSLSNVPSGDYYVTAQMTGYVNEGPTVQSALSAGGDALNALGGIPQIHVAAGGATALLSLQRGAVVGGTVLWDDGSPAAGVQVSAVAPPANGTAASTGLSGGGGFAGFGRGFGGTSTDDRGRFRLSGLSPGAYLIRAAVQAPVRGRGDDRGSSRTLTLFVYAPDKQRRSEATAVTLAAGEEHGDVNVTLGLAGLHTVSGVVGSPGAAVRAGTVTLSDSQDSTLNRSGTIVADGSFSIPYVPAGTYSMRISASAQPGGNYNRGSPATGADAGPRFQPLQQSLTVADGDVSGLALNVTPVTASSTPGTP